MKAGILHERGAISDIIIGDAVLSISDGSREECEFAATKQDEHG
jgi:hypothetical protein